MPSLLMSVTLSRLFKVSILKVDLNAFGDAGKDVFVLLFIPFYSNPMAFEWISFVQSPDFPKNI